MCPQLKVRFAPFKSVSVNCEDIACIYPWGNDRIELMRQEVMFSYGLRNLFWKWKFLNNPRHKKPWKVFVRLITRYLHHSPFDTLVCLLFTGSDRVLAMSFLIRLLNLAVWFMMSWSLGSLQCPRKCTCLRTLFSNLSKVKCVGIDQVPTGIPPNTVMLYVS